MPEQESPFHQWNVGDEYTDGEYNYIIIDREDGVVLFDSEGTITMPMSESDFSEMLYELRAKQVTEPLIDRLKAWCEQHPDFPVEKMMPNGQ